MLDGSDVVVGLCDAATGELVAFARVLTDSVYEALVLDVVVAPSTAVRGSGAG